VKLSEADFTVRRYTFNELFIGLILTNYIYELAYIMMGAVLEGGAQCSRLRSEERHFIMKYV